MPVHKRGNTYWIRFQINHKTYAFSAGKGATYEQAKAIEAKARQDIVRGKLEKQNYTLEEAAVRWLDGEARTLKDYKKLLKTTALILPHIEDTPIEQAQNAAQRIIEAFRHLKPATINRRLAIVRRLTNLAWSWGWTDRQIKIELLTGEEARHVYLSPEQVEELADDAGRAKWHVILAAYTGMREGEILNIDRTLITDDYIVINKSKNNKPRVVPLNDTAREALNNLDWTVTYPMLRKCFEKARGDQNIRFHDLRHTAASFMVQGGAGLTAVRDVLGHSNLGVTSRYSHLAFDDQKKAVDKMPNCTKTVQNKKSQKLKSA